MRQLCAFILAVMLLTQVALAAYAWSLADQRFLPALERKAQTIGVALAGRLTFAIDQGTPLAQAASASAAWQAILARHGDIAYILLTDASGKVLYRGGAGAEVIAPENYLDTRADIVHRYVRHGQVHVGVERGYVRTRMLALRYDLAILLLASLCIAFEALWFIVTLNFSAPVRQVIAVMRHMAAGDFRHRTSAGPPDALAARLNALEARINDGFREVAQRAAVPGQQAVGAIVLRRLRARYRFDEDGSGVALPRLRIVTVRLLTFLCVFAAMVAQPVLAQHGAASALPVSAFVLALAFTLARAGPWSDRVGRRRSYVTGALIAAAALACTAFGPDLAWLILARAAAGAGVALMLSACHGYAHDNADGGSARALAQVAGGAALAACCAPAAGAILADHLGHGGAYLAGAAAALAGAALAAAVLDGRAGRSRERVRVRVPAPRLTMAALGVPAATFLYTGIFMLLVPLMTSQLDSAGLLPLLAGFSAALQVLLFSRQGRRCGMLAGLAGAAGPIATTLLARDIGPGGGMLALHSAALGAMLLAALGLVVLTHRRNDPATAPILDRA
ncbi:MFS transporter [Massilia antarctica]|uniref:MFS transporter n=1 Tax=Massilia antarctica TaxID=2765360 RepID=UPI001E4A965F|nr:MFS transporter [Massilia antarctica]